LYNLDCSTSREASDVSTDGGGVVTLTIDTAGSYVLGIKYDPGTVVGTTVPGACGILPTNHYDFATKVNGTTVETDPDGLNLSPK
jgi:hypothetical protein